MTDPDESDRRIDRLERELAQVQTDTTYTRIEAILGRQRLKATLVIAVKAIGRMSTALAASVQPMADEINGAGTND
ncbi:MAG TPA: hypothetical protein VK634_06910 [Reyranella sp.]|nr:hypothetical protein [Reyranella sp.]